MPKTITIYNMNVMGKSTIKASDVMRVDETVDDHRIVFVLKDRSEIPTYITRDEALRLLGWDDV